jgi:hypothetical protein
VRLVADTPGSKHLVDFARTTVEPGSRIRTDGTRMFRCYSTEYDVERYFRDAPHDRRRRHQRNPTQRHHHPTGSPRRLLVALDMAARVADILFNLE